MSPCARYVLSLLWRRGVAPLALFCLWALPTGSAAAQPTFSQQMFPAEIGPGSAARLTYTIGNGGGGPIADLAFSHTLPAAITVANPAALTTDCGMGSVTAPAGGGTVTLAGGRVGAGGTCTIELFVTSSTPGLHTSITGDLTSSAGNSGTASDDLEVLTSRPGVSMSLSPSSVPWKSRTTLTFLMDNSFSADGFSFASWSLDLPPAYSIADPAMLMTTCESGGFSMLTLTGTPGGSQVTLNNAAAAAGSTCTVTVDLIADAVGTHELVSGAFTSGTQTNPTQRSSGFAVAAGEVTTSFLQAALSIIDDPVAPGGAPTLEVTLQNTTRTAAMTSIAMSVDMEATLSGLVAGPLPTDPCGAGSSLSGTSLLSLSGGLLAPEASCTFTVPLSVPAAAVPGAYALAATAPSAMDDGGRTIDGTVNQETLTVTGGPTLMVSFVEDSAVAGQMITADFTLQSQSPSSATTDIEFQFSLGDFIPGALATLPAAGFCGGGSLAFANQSGGVDFVTVTGAQLADSGSCTFQIGFTLPDSVNTGTATLDVPTLTSTVGGSGTTSTGASDSIELVSAPQISLSFPDGPQSDESPQTLRVSVANPGESSLAASDITFTIDLEAALSGLVASGTPLMDVCGTGSMLSGTSVLTLAAGTLGPEESCAFDVTVAPPAAFIGTATVSSSSLSATVSGVTATTPGGSAELVVAPLRLSMEFLDDPVEAGEVVTVQFSIENASATEAATNLFFTQFITGLSGAAYDTVTAVSPCGGGSMFQNIGTTGVLLTAGALGAGESCTFQVTLTTPAGAAAGSYGFETSSLSATIGGSVATFDPGRDQLVIGESISLVADFAQPSVMVGGTATLQLTLTNFSPITRTMIDVSVDLDDALTGLVAGTLPATACGGTISGTSVVTVSGASLDGLQSCVVDVPVVFPVTSPSSVDVEATLTGDNAGSDTATIRVDALTLGKSFDGPVAVGEVALLTITITNLSSTEVADVRLVDDLDAMLAGAEAVGPLASDPCGAGSTLTGTSVLALNDASLPGDTSCEFTVMVRVPPTATDGTYMNSTSPLSQGGADVHVPATASLVVTPAPPPIATLEFAPTSITEGQTSVLTATLDNTAAAAAVSSVGWTAAIPSGLSVESAASITNGCGGTATASATELVVAGATIAAGATCTVAIEVVAVAGQYTVTIPQLDSSAGTGAGDSAMLSVAAAPDMGTALGDMGPITGDMDVAGSDIGPVADGGAQPDAGGSLRGGGSSCSAAVRGRSTPIPVWAALLLGAALLVRRRRHG